MTYCSTLALQETKLGKSVSDAVISLKGFNTFRKDIRKNSAGMIVYVQQNLQASIVHILFNLSKLHVLAIKLKLKTETILCTDVYHRPNKAPGDDTMILSMN